VTVTSLFLIDLLQTFHGFRATQCAIISLFLSGCVLSPHEHDKGPETAPEGLTALSASAVAEGEQEVNFERQIKPILESKCLACHSGQTAPWSYSLETRKLAFASGAGGPRIIAGKPDQSIIVAFASTHKNAAAMPLVGNRLTEKESKILRRWIAEGAGWPTGKAGELKPSSDALRPERAPLRHEWRFWFDKGQSNP
jgi:mono/diheme cytochrome c family protein